MRNRPALLAISVIFFVSCHSSFNKIMKSKDPEYKLRCADSFFNAKKYNKAQQLYEGLFAVYKGDKKFEELYYKYAYTFYYQKIYDQAEQMFKGYLEVFPNSENAEDARYMQAFMLYKQSPKLELEQTNTTKAMSAMQAFIINNPGSKRIPEATAIIDELRLKLEAKDDRTADLYYNIGQYRAAALAYANLLNKYPESAQAEEYKFMTIKSYYKFAALSVEEKQEERYEKVITEYQDFADRFPDSKKLKEAEEYFNLSKNQIKNLKNEQVTPAIQ